MAQDGRLEPRLLGRRSLPRVPVDLALTLHLAGLPALPARAREIGVGGVCIATPTRLPLAELRRVSLHSLDTRLKLDVEVRWQAETPGRDGFLAGLEFTNVNPWSRDALWDIVHSQTKRLASLVSRETDLEVIGLADLVDLIHAMRIRDGGTGEVLFRRGCRQAGDDSIFLLLSGKVAIETASRDGRRVSLGEARAGELLCSNALLGAAEPLETALVSEASSLFEISRASFGFIQAVHPLLAAALTTILVRRYVGRQHEALAAALEHAAA
jgi:hypothetical protein